MKKKQVKRLEMERDILKKVVADSFASCQGSRS